jgi:acetylserotonin N-methyltransferase
MADADATVVLNLIEAFRRSKTMFTAVSLGVFDHLDEEGPLILGDLAARTGCEAESLERLLAGCCALGLLEHHGASFRNTATASQYLTRRSLDNLVGYILYSDKVLWGLWAHLEDGVKTGTHRWEQAFGLQGAIFSHFFRTEEARKTFISGMHGFGRLSSPEVVKVFNLARFRRIVDLGGATGHLAIAACERYGSMSGVVFDLAEVVPLARPYLAASRASGRLSAVAGDFFEDALPEADLYALGRILHDWGEAKILRLLEKIHASLPPGGGVLIVEALLDDDGLSPAHALMQSLNMLVCTEGKERTAAGYAALLEAAGFGQVEARRTGAPLDAVLAIRKQ